MQKTRNKYKTPFAGIGWSNSGLNRSGLLRYIFTAVAMYAPTLTILITCTHPAAAQNPEYRSLENATQYLSKQQIDTLLPRAFNASTINPDSVINELHQLRQFSESIHYTKGIADALSYIGMTYLVFKKDPETGLDYLRESLRAYRKLKKQDSQWMVEWHNSVGAAFHRQGLPDSAAHHYARALDLALHTNDRRLIVMLAYNNMGTLLLDLHQYENARFYLNKAEILGLLEAERKTELPAIYQNMAASYAYEKQTDSALYYIQKIEALHVPFSNTLQERQHMLLGMVNFYTGNANESVQEVRQALSLSEGKTLEVTQLNNLATAYSLAKNFQEAERYLKLALHKVNEENLWKKDKTLMFRLYSNLANLYDSTKNYTDAYYYRTLSSIVADSINQIEKTKVIHQMDIRYRTAEKDKRIAEGRAELLFTQQKLNRKNLWVIFITVGALLLSLTFITLFQRQRLKLQKARAAQQQQQIDKLKAVLDGEENERTRIGRQLHDDVMVSFSIAKINLAALPNEFPAVKATTAFENISKQLNQTGIKIRQTAHNLMPDALLTEGLLFAISYFCKGINKSGELRVRFQHYGSLPALPTETQVNLYRIVQELVQNVVKHAHASEALVQLYSRKDTISITVDDNGTGIADPEKAEAGLGLKSIRSRLKVMVGEMDIRSVDPHGTAVHIEVRL